MKPKTIIAISFGLIIIAIFIISSSLTNLTGYSIAVINSSITAEAETTEDSFHPASNINDWNSKTYWQGQVPNYIKFDFGEEKTIEKIKIQGHVGWSYGLKHYTIQSSSDGINWKDEIEIKKLGAVYACNNAEKSKEIGYLCVKGYEFLTFPNYFSTKFLKIVIHESYPYEDKNSVVIKEIYFWEAS